MVATSFLTELIWMCFALWDGNGLHNQLELQNTAALWVPLQSHPPERVSDWSLVGLLLLEDE